MTRYMYSNEDLMYLRKHSKTIMASLRLPITLKHAMPSILEAKKTHVFSDCHFYQGIENVIWNTLKNENDLEILTSAIEVIRDRNLHVISKEFEITVTDGIMTYKPDGSEGY